MSLPANGSYLAHRERHPNNLDKPGSLGQPAEYTLYPEEDCTNKVVSYVFIDHNGVAPQQRIEYRCQCHCRSKTEPENDPTNSKMEQACEDGWGVGAEPRFSQEDGELLSHSLEKFLCKDLKFAPTYDLNQQKKISQ